MSLGGDRQPSFSARSKEKSVNQTRLRAHTEKCLTATQSLIRKAEELLRNAAQTLEEKKELWVKIPPGNAELLRICSIIEVCKEVIPDARDSLRTLKGEALLFKFHLDNDTSEGEITQEASAEMGKISSDDPQHLKDVQNEEMFQSIEEREAFQSEQIKRARSQVENAARTLKAAEVKYYNVL